MMERKDYLKTLPYFALLSQSSAAPYKPPKNRGGVAFQGSDGQSFQLGVNMGFKTEEDIEEWYKIEKQRLETEFLNNINKDKDNIPKHREKFGADMKRLIARYEAEHYKMMDKKKGVKEK